MSGTEMDFLSEGVSGGAAGGGDDGPLTTSGHELTTSGHGRHGPHAGFAGRGRREGGDATTCVLLRDGGAAKVPEEAHGEGEGQKDAPTDTQTHTHTHTHEDDEVTMKLYEYAEVHMKIAPTEFKAPGLKCPFRGSYEMHVSSSSYKPRIQGTKSQMSVA